MNITTENIDEWCFRYLEKDLNEEELNFFEHELQHNSWLIKQMSLWQKTIVTTEPSTQAEHSIEKNLLRYRNQFLLSLLELVLAVSLIFYVVSNATTQKKSSIKNTDHQTSTALDATINIENDSTSIENGLPNNSTYVNLLLDQQNDSVFIFENDEVKSIEQDTIISKTNFFTPAIEKTKQADSVKVISDTSVTQKKTSQKKNSAKHKYKGSRLVPINNDL